MDESETTYFDLRAFYSKLLLYSRQFKITEKFKKLIITNLWTHRKRAGVDESTVKVRKEYILRDLILLFRFIFV